MTISEIIGKILGIIGLLLCLACFIWLGLSWWEVASKNLTINPTYSDYNFFIVVFGK